MKIETRADCIVCGADIVDARFRTYCSDKCRIKRNNEKSRAYATEWRKINRAKVNERARMRTVRNRLAKVIKQMK